MTRTVFTLAISRSKQCLIYLIVIHTMMLATLLSLLGLTIESLLVCVLMGFSFNTYCRQYQWLQGDNAVTMITRDQDNKWSLFEKSGVQYQQLVLHSSIVCQQLVMLNFKANKTGSTKSIMIMSDSVDADDLRQLRIYCREPKTFLQ